MDHYATLGLVPEADPIVIKAAYRALAQAYHPDKWRGDPGTATRRMAEINEAYRVLGDVRLRAEYDSVRDVAKNGQPYGEDRSGEREDAFSSALSETEHRWSVATSVLPDLVSLRNNLSRISTSLSFAFVTLLLESQQFSERKAIAEKLEVSFLSQYFGSNKQVLEFAKDLIMSGEKEAAKLLNQLIDVLGTNIEPRILINQVTTRYPMSSKSHLIRELTQKLDSTGDINFAKNIANLKGFSLNERPVGLFNFKITVSKEGEKNRDFPPERFISWVRENLCTD